MLKYIELDGKKPKHTFDTFSTDHSHYKDAGVILNNKVVVVDFDDEESAAVGSLIYNQYPTLKVKTGRGIHLYYRKPKHVFIKNWTKKLTTVGVLVDYKLGSKAQGIIKQNGRMRPMENEHLLGQWEQLPLLPLELHPSKLSQPLLSLEEGQGRNNFLFTHLLAVREMYQDVTNDQIEALARFIESHVLAAPLDKGELDRLIESVLSKSIHEIKNKFLDPKDVITTSEIIAKEFQIKYYNQALYFKTENGWITDNNKLLRAIDKRIKLKPRQQSELLKRLEVDAELVEEEHFPIRFNNGWCLDQSNEVIPVESEFTPFNLDVAYNPDAYDEHVDKFLNFVTKDRAELRAVLEEMFGHILMTHSFPHKAFFLTGESGGNGKSTLLEMLNNFVGELGHTLSLEDFNETFQIATLDGKLANIGDDIDAAYLERSKNFKTLVSGNTIAVRRMYGEPFKLKNKATLIFTCNEMPTFKDKSGGIARRLVIIPFDNKVTTIDPKIDQKLSSNNAKSYLLKVAIEGMQRILSNGGISHSQTIEDMTKQYLTENDSVLSYLHDRELQGKTIEGYTVDTVFLQYQNYCEDNGLKAVGKIAMSRRINSAGYATKVKKVGGKAKKVYEKIG
ncbi:phage/plasmid primase, P4 family [Halalkalibacterium halodurans]|uniref:phage/plasmid primase, P4 family n=1 Tax=Halalkalibacterium halodurans TaxID=86665 RepID=UPI002AA981A0|nr:phage/plasmid primase, P4 family [Halalkalibacterium halodurans]MDY7224643.1 phage/plasmid primase, P4 family [Halalkalibacterium halodurans]MDY7243250.1 phage/plasmid primase, P4 family [Halalkalibacterium halodurans]